MVNNKKNERKTMRDQLRNMFKNKGFIVFVVIFALTGGLVLRNIFAATPNASFEAENISLSGSAVKCTGDSNASAGGYIILNQTACPGTTPPPPPPPTSDCLTRSSISKPSGTVSSWKSTPANGSTVDARNLVVTNLDTWLVTPGGGSDVCWYGGELYNTSTSNVWETPWHHTGGFTLKNNNNNFIFDSVYVHHTGDAFNMSDTATNWTIRNSHIDDIRDDCVQNDYYNAGTIDGNLFSGCYVLISAKASGSTQNGSSNIWNVTNNLFYLKPMQSVYKGPAPGNGPMIKWGSTGYEPYLKFNNNIVRAEQGKFGSEAYDFIFKGEFKNNVLLWTGSGSVPSELTAQFSGNGNSILTGSAATNYWNQKVAEWKTANPGVK